MKQLNRAIKRVLFFAILMSLSGLLISCKNEDPNRPVLIVDFPDILRQVGVEPNMSVGAFAEGDVINAPEDVKTIALGALDLSYHDSDFYYHRDLVDTSMSFDDLRAEWEETVRNDIIASYSAGYLKLVQRIDFQNQPYVEFTYPIGDARFQIVAIAFTITVDGIDSAEAALSDMSNPKFSHGGATENQVFTANTITEDQVIELEMLSIDDVIAELNN